MKPVSLIFTPALLGLCGLLALDGPVRLLGGKAFLVLVFLLPVLALAAAGAAVFDLFRIARAGNWSAHVLRLAIHGVGLAASAFIVWQTVQFLTHGLDRLF